MNALIAAIINNNYYEENIYRFLDGYKAECEECGKKYILYIIVNGLDINDIEEIKEEDDQDPQRVKS